MNDRSERVRAAFHEGTDAPEWNRDAVLSGVLQHARQVRRQRTYRLTGTAVAAMLILGVVWLQLRATSARHPTPTIVGSVPVTFDSISITPAEEAVTHQDRPGTATTITRHETPANLIPLLGHRSALSSDLEDFVDKRDDLTAALNANPGGERAAQLQAQIAGTEADIASTRNALRIVDQQLAALQGSEVPVVVHEPIAFSESPPSPMVIQYPLPGEPFAWAAGISLTALLIVFAALLAIRRTMRSAVDTLSSLQGQASTQLNALTSGIEAIAIEVERLGENQRFLSKAIAGDAKEGVSARGGT